MDRARDWAIRCQLELQIHSEACWTTLTYEDSKLPPTLQKPHLSGWLKRLRARHSDRTLRFFAAGEYGDRTNRPHYHAILFGLPDHPSIQDTWPFGYARVDEITPAAIAYVAGYCSKKIGWKLERGERVDPETGEVYEYQPPFNLMSRRPGLASHARAHWRSWRDTAIHNGREVPAPRYLKEAFKASASPTALRKQQDERLAKYSLLPSDFSLNWDHDRLQALAKISLAKHTNQSKKRTAV